MQVLFKTHNDVAFFRINGISAVHFINQLDMSIFEVKRVKMEGGSYRLKYTCLEDNIKVLVTKDTNIYLDKGFHFYQF